MQAALKKKQTIDKFALMKMVLAAFTKLYVLIYTVRQQKPCLLLTWKI